MTPKERIDQLEARLLAYGLAMHILARHATPEARQAIAAVAESVTDHALPFEFTDLQIEQVREVLSTFGS
jgi:hypothetical protein